MSTPVTDKGFKVAHLICVTGENNNKFYNMTQVSPDEFEAHWGRVDVTEDRKMYPMKDWDKIYKDKTKLSKKPKPYTDVTSFRAEVSINESATTSMFNESRAKAVREFVEMLMRLANQSVEKNYTVSAAKVTKAQVDEAQKVIDELTPMFVVGSKAEDINDMLIKLYHIIPRKMKKVQDHLIESSTTIKDEAQLKSYMDDILLIEQDALDAMSGQVAMNTKKHDTTPEEKVKNDNDILSTLGLDLFECRPAEIEMIKGMLGPNAKQFVRAYRTVNHQTQGQYDKWMDKVKNNKKALLWHGFRNENWWSIVQQGLKIRPSNAVLTGSMFGYGVYFADKAQKSIGYTSMRGSRWANGGSQTAILALYEIHQGNQKEVTKWKSEHSSLDETKMKRTGHDSVFAKGGYDLVNNEFIIYNQAQSTIQYLVEINHK